MREHKLYCCQSYNFVSPKDTPSFDGMKEGIVITAAEASKLRFHVKAQGKYHNNMKTKIFKIKLNLKYMRPLHSGTI